MNLFDTHAHLLDERFDEDRAQVLSALPAAGITGMVEAGCEEAYALGTLDGSLTMCARLPTGQLVEAAILGLEALPAVAEAQPNYLYPLIEAEDVALPEPAPPVESDVEPAVDVESNADAGISMDPDTNTGADEPMVAAEEADTPAATPEAAAPNDPDADTTRQWHLYKTNTLAAWDTVDAAPAADKTRVVVLDTTIELGHEDLAENLLPALAADYSSGVQQLYGTVPPDSHGTHVAGLIAARSNNSIGVAGMATGSANQAVELVPVNVFRRGTTGGLTASTSAMVAGLNYALACGADVINMSLGYPRAGSMNSYDRLLENAVDAAAAAGVPVVCAAGNTITGGVQTLFLPSDFDTALGVISLEENDTRSLTSNYGDKKFIAAPGAALTSTVLANQYGAKSGTSMAAPVVSSVACMMLYVNPALGYDDIVDILATTAFDLYTPNKDAQSGWGRVDAAAAVAAAAVRPASGAAAVQQVAMATPTADLLVGETQALVATALPRNLADRTVAWHSPDPAVATVDANGLVTGIGPGQVTLEATAGGQTATCLVTVTQPVSGVQLEPAALELKLGKGQHLTATVSPANATNQDLKWQSDNPAVATVTAAGYVQALAVGVATITVETVDGGHTASCVVTAVPAETGTIIQSVTAWDGSRGSPLVSWTLDANMASFMRLDVTGPNGATKTLQEPRDYLRSEGSVVLTLTKAYLNSLPNGRYRMDAVFTFGTVTDGFTIAVPQASSSTPPDSSSSEASSVSAPQALAASPQTGDDANMGLWILLAVIAVVVVVIVVLVFRQQGRRK